MLSRSPTLWYDPLSTTVFWYGGWPYNAGDYPAVWGFNTNDQGGVSWVSKYTAGIGKTATGSSTFNNFTCPGGALYAASPTAYYSLGGYMAASSDPALSGLGGYRPALSGMVIYDFQKEFWSNTTSAGYQQAGFGVEGEAVYVPIFGEKGIIVFIGGDAPTSQAWTEGASLVPMSQITIYDIQSGKFYQQPASGSDMPIARAAFCAVGVGAANNSSYEMYVLISCPFKPLSYQYHSPYTNEDNLKFRLRRL